jgi:hypothetical protein
MKMSSLLSSLVIKPYPLFTLNHFTLPVIPLAMMSFFSCSSSLSGLSTFSALGASSPDDMTG